MSRQRPRGAGPQRCVSADVAVWPDRSGLLVAEKATGRVTDEVRREIGGLVGEVKAVQQRDPEAEFVLLVPATPVRHLLRRGDEHDAEVRARKLADRARAMFAKKGVNLSDARVGAESPIDAIDDEMKANPGYAGFIISTLPKETSRWLRMDLPRTVGSKYGLPVYHVMPPEEWTFGDLP